MSSYLERTLPHGAKGDLLHRGERVRVRAGPQEVLVDGEAGLPDGDVELRRGHPGGAERARGEGPQLGGVVQVDLGVRCLPATIGTVKWETLLK